MTLADKLDAYAAKTGFHHIPHALLIEAAEALREKETPARAVVVRPAHDETDDCFAWMVWNGSLNVTGAVARKLGIVDWPPGAVFSSEDHCEAMAQAFNEGRK